MRRKRVKTEKKKYGSHTIKPWFFWKECNICGYEVRREPVHVVDIHWYKKHYDGLCCSNPEGHDRFYICNACFLTLEDAEKWFESNHLEKYAVR